MSRKECINQSVTEEDDTGPMVRAPDETTPNVDGGRGNEFRRRRKNVPLHRHIVRFGFEDARLRLAKIYPLREDHAIARELLFMASQGAKACVNRQPVSLYFQQMTVALVCSNCRTDLRLLRRPERSNK